MAGFWHEEKVSYGRKISHFVENPWIFEGEEYYAELGGNFKQIIQIGDFRDFGRGLVINGLCQMAEKADEQYTFPLVYPAAFSSPSHENWLILGGADGPAAREALSFYDTKEVVLADISKMVFNQTRIWIPTFWGGRANDLRLKIIHEDALSCLERFAREEKKFDIIISDLTDLSDKEFTPYARSAADHLYTEYSFDLIKSLLKSRGVFTMQAQELSYLRWKSHKKLRDLLNRVFSNVYSYRVPIEFFGCQQSFLMATMKRNGDNPFLSYILSEYASRTAKMMEDVIDFAAWLISLFSLDKFLQKEFEQVPATPEGL